MEIGPLSNHPSGQQAEEPGKLAPKSVNSEPGREIVDRIDISLDARARLAELADHELKKERSAPTPIDPSRLKGAARIDAIRHRIETGFYDRPEVRVRIADNLIDDWDS